MAIVEKMIFGIRHIVFLDAVGPLGLPICGRSMQIGLDVGCDAIVSNGFAIESA